MSTPTTPAGALREFEQRFLSQRTTAAERESMRAWEADMIPPNLGEGNIALLEEGFEAGFAAAMNRVRRTLAQLQSETNAAARGADALDRLLAHDEQEGS